MMTALRHKVSLACFLIKFTLKIFSSTECSFFNPFCCTCDLNSRKKKIKATIYLTEEAEQAFTELYIHRLHKDRKIDHSVIACDAIQLLL